MIISIITINIINNNSIIAKPRGALMRKLKNCVVVNSEANAEASPAHREL